MKRGMIALLIVLAATCVGGLDSLAAVEYPAKGKTIILQIPWPAGGTTDIGARVLAPALEKELGVNIEIINKPGASSQVGVTELARAKPDGYYLAFTNLPSSMSPYLEPGRKAAYGRKDLVQIANHVFDPEGVAVKAGSPYKTLKDLLADAKAKPGTIRVSSSGIMSDNHLAIVLLEKMAGVKFRIVHFQGSAPATTALLGGHVDVSIQSLANYPALIKSGEVRVLGIMDKETSKFFPGVKTLEEQGYKIYYASSRGISAPPGTPREIVNLLSRAVKRAMERPEVAAKMDEMALGQRYMDAEAYTKYWDDFEKETKQLIELAK